MKSENYRVWTDRCKRTFIVYKTWDIVSARRINSLLFHDEDKPVDLAEEIFGEVADRQEKDNLTAEALMKSLSDKIADSPRDLPTSHDI